MRLFNLLAAAGALVLGSVKAAVIVHYETDLDVVTVTPGAVYVTVTANADMQTVIATVTSVTTIYTAKSSPTVTVTGSIITTVSSITEAPVTQYSTYPTTAVSASINLAKYASSSVAIDATSVVSVADSDSTSLVEPDHSTSFAVSRVELTASNLSSAFSSDFNSDSGVACTTYTIVEGSTTLLSTSYAVVASSTSSLSSSATVAVATSAVGSSLASSTPVETSSTPVETSSAPIETSSAPPSKTVGAQSGQYYTVGNIMGAIDTAAPYSAFPSSSLAITMPTGVNNGDNPIHTNKFYANLFLGSQTEPVYCQPYSVWWSKDSNYYGLGISHTTPDQRTYGPDASASTVEYYINPIGLISAAFSAEEFTSSNMALSTSDFDTFSVTASLSSSSGGSIDFPITLGMGLVTAQYNSLTPRIFSQIGFKSVTKGDGLASSAGTIDKYVAELFNGVTWAIFVTRSNNDDFTLNVDDNYQITGSKSVNGLVIQIGVIADTSNQSILDSAAGLYATSVSLDASVSGDSATYTLDYATQGASISGNLLIYALPHHVDSFASSMDGSSTSFQLNSPTKGLMTGYLTTKFVLEEDLHTTMQFLPWSSSPKYGGVSYNSSELSAIAAALNSELTQDISAMTNVGSTYTAGKIADKFAYMLLVAKDILKDDESTKSILNSLKSALAVWTSNTQPIPLMYDTLFKGVTSSAAQNGGNPNDDYGSPYYNDHHFHYGYWVHTAAIVGYTDAAYGGTWAQDNKDWVNSLIRDVANPSSDDSYFPVFRMFDFFNGHSWAAGLFESGDGKNEESTSEDVNFAYGMKMWGKVIGDQSMEARGDLMVSVLARSLDAYFLMQDDNINQPSQIIGNKVTGISYENKVDHTTFFGTNEEYIQGIQMLPIIPASGLTRSQSFVQQEWDEKLQGLVDSLNSGWLGILRSNQALIDPDSAYAFFSQTGFSTNWLDNGASLTWYLTLSAGLKGI